MPDRPNELACADLVWNLEDKEIAVNRIWLRHKHQSGNTFDWDSALQRIADKCVASLSDSEKGGAIFPQISNQVTLSRVDAYAIPPVGKATNKKSATPSGTTGGSASGDYSPIMGAVVQLWGYPPSGFVANARRHRGRLFVAGTPMSYFMNQGELGTDTALQIATGWGHFLNDLQGASVAGGITPGNGDDYVDVGVLSRTDGAFYPLQAVTCATKPGIQHSRMNKLVTLRSTPVTITGGN